MGQRVEFASDAHTCQGYLATPSSGSGPGVVVIQEYWGLVPHIENVAERFASEGFASIAPDLYHGKTAKSPDDAAKMLMEVDIDRAGAEIDGAAKYLLQRPECSSRSFGVIGFCMGGALAQYTATRNEKVSAIVSFYGGFKKVEPEWDRLAAPILLIYGEQDKGVPPEKGRDLEQKLKEMGKRVELVVYPGAGHAFFNDTRPSYNPQAAADAWRRTLDLFRQNIH